MRILQINTFDVAGGAERIALQLFKGTQERGHDSWLMVGKKKIENEHILEIPDRRNRMLLSLSEKIHALPKFFGRSFLGNFIEELSIPLVAKACRGLGIEDFEYPNSRKINRLIPGKPDICHAHNLHTDYFDLRQLPALSKKVPLLITLHDAWLLSGHCAHSFDCERWITGCGNCPDLSIYPEIRRDATAYNWKRKQKIFNNSAFNIACPSRWLMNKVELSILKPSMQMSRVIPNGIDLSIFNPKDQKTARAEIGLPQDCRIILAVGNRLKSNIWKDFPTLEAAVRLSGSDKKTLFVVVGENIPGWTSGNTEFCFVAANYDQQILARYYQAADVFIHAAHAETFGTTILEALACGCPVIATAVGGIPEQIIEAETGFLTPKSDPMALSEKIRILLDSPDLRQRLGYNAAEYASRHFSLEKMVNSYLEYYVEILDRWSRGGGRTPEKISRQEKR
jgi:glycosyltransferase involved in cell wall biosynthesis